MRRTWWASWLFLAACGVEQPRDPGGFGGSLGTEEGPAPCVPGEQVACACPGGAPDGVQICSDEGDRFGECMGCPGGSESGGSTLDGADTNDTASASSSNGDPSSTTTDGGSDSDTWGLPPEGPPDAFYVVEQVAMEHPDWLLASCVDTGGNNDFLFEVVRRLRMIDPRWGLNWKRGVVGDLSQDVVDYHWGDGEPEESTDVFIIDIIVGHCGDTPQAGWIDVTLDTLKAGTVGMWTLAGQDL